MRKSAHWAAAGVLAVGGVLGSSGIAQAATPTQASSVVTSATIATGVGDCPAGYLCFWSLQNYSGAMGKLKGSNNFWSVFPQTRCTSGSWNNCAESMYNRHPYCTAFLYDYTSQQGAYHRLAPGDRTYNMFGDYRNRVSSNGLCV